MSVQPPLADWFDLATFERILQSFSELTGYASALVDHQNQILIATGWQEICVRFHRANPQSELLCQQSNQELFKQLSQNSVYGARCAHGLWDYAVPIVIDGEKVASIFIGQIFHEPPDEDFYKQRAQTFGFDEEQYLQALHQVPRLPKEKTQAAFSMITQIAQNFAILAKERKQLLEALSKQQRIEQELQKTSAFYREILERIEAVTYVDAVDEFSSSIYVSPQIENLFGYTPQEWVETADLWFKVIHPADLERVKQENRRTNETGEPFDMQYRVITKDGRVIWVRDQAVMNRDESGNPLYWLGTFEDITQQKLAEETLRREEMRFQALLQLYQMSQEPLTTITNFFLDATLNLTQSKLGFLGFINEDESAMTVYAWSQEAWQQCQMLNQPSEFPLESAGLWAETVRQRRALIVNDYHAPYPSKSGYPEGHVPIERFLGVPLLEEGKVVLLAGLSNKPTEYNEDDARQITLLMNGLWTLILRKRAEEALKERLLKLTSPSTQLNAITLEDIFDLQEIQAIQDAFAEATGVASIITDIHGRPITKPSNFCRLCKEIIRTTEIGLQNCMASDAELGKPSEEGFNMQPCLSGGLWDSGTPIMVGDQPVAYWLIGQVMDENLKEEDLIPYADVIGADREAFRQALKEVKRMPLDQFKQITQALHLIAKQLSRLAVQNIQQAQFIAERQRVEETLAQERTILRTLINQIPDAIYVKDQYARKTLSNATDLYFMGLNEEAEVLGKTDFDIFPREIAEQFYADDLRVLQQGEAVINKEEISIDVRGEKRYLLTTKVPIRDKEGNIVRLVGVGRDITERKKAEEALLRERNLLRDLVYNAPDTIFIKDRQSRFVLCNPVVAQRHGFSNPEELIGKTDFDIHEQSVAAQFYAEEQHVMESGEPFFNREQCYYDEKGQLRWVSSTKVPWRNEKGEIIGVIGINRDITEQKIIEETIRRERNLLRALIDSAIDQVFVKDKEGRFVLCNPATIHSLGKENLEEVIGKTDFDFFPPELAERFYAEEQLIFRSAQPLVNREAKIVDEHGNVRWISTNKVAWRNEYGEVIGLVGINRDITEQKLAQEALFRERYLLQAIVNGTPDHIYVKDHQSRFLMCNPATASSFGLDDPAQMVGKSDFDFHPLDKAQTYFAEEQNFMESGKPMVNVERLEKFADGSEHWLSVTKLPLYNEKGEVVGTVGINRDITEIKRAEQEVRKLNAELEQRVVERTAQLADTIRELEDFAYAVSHDLRTPLRGIDGFSQALLEEYSTTLAPDAIHYLERIRKASQRMGQIIDDLLKLSRVTRANLVRIPINLSQIAESYLQEMQLLHPERKIQVIIKPDIIVEADPNLMRMALINLLDNAWKFSAPKSPAVIEFGESIQHGEQVYFVRDNGVGFDMAYAHKIFGAFQRLHHISEFEGTGIGLATVYRVIQRHGGKIWAESVLGQGTTMYFTL